MAGSGNRAFAGAGLGLVAAIVGFLILPIGDAIGKLLAESGLPILQLTWGRWAFHSLLLTPLVLILYRGRALKIVQPVYQVARAAALIIASVFFFNAVKLIPLADATAILFIAPLIVVALSALFLGERVGKMRWAAVFIGFLGVLLIVRPGTESLRIGAFLALGAAICFSLYMVLTRKVAGSVPPMIAMWWMGLIGMVTMTILAVPGWQPPDPPQWGWMALIGLIMLVGHLLVFWAADRVEASAMAVTPYLEMITSTVLGLLVFGDFPDVLTWVGCGVVVLSGLFVVWRENRIARTTSTPEAAGPIR